MIEQDEIISRTKRKKATSAVVGVDPHKSTLKYD